MSHKKFSFLQKYILPIKPTTKIINNTYDIFIHHFTRINIENKSMQ